MGVKSFTDALGELLTTDTRFVADIAALIGKPVTTVLHSNMPWASITANQLPCFIVEQAPGQASPWGGSDESGLTIGHTSQQFASDIDVCLLWNEQDREKAGDQRTQLPDIFVRLMLRNPQPGHVAGAWLHEFVPDQGVLHPRQCWSARIRAQYDIERDA